MKGGDTESDDRIDIAERRFILRKHKAITASIILVAFVALLGISALIYNNVSIINDTTFTRRVDKAIEKGESWIESHRTDILSRQNSALLQMLNESCKLKHNPVFDDIIKTFLSTPSWPTCWRRLVDDTWFVNKRELNSTIKKETLDNKWVLYAIAPDKADVTPQQLQLFDRQKWRGTALTHQLDALINLRLAKGTNKELEELIDHLANRVKNELVFDLAVTDPYIQKVTFILRAGYPQKIRRRWVERIIANQLHDGGWNNQWFCLTSGKKPKFDSSPSNQHATVQAVLALYLVRYGYPEHFGLE